MQRPIRSNAPSSDEYPAPGAADSFERGSDTSFLVDVDPAHGTHPNAHRASDSAWPGLLPPTALVLLLLALLMRRCASRRRHRDLPLATTIAVAHWSVAQRGTDSDFPAVTRPGDGDSLTA